jgi:hypothetical protein
MKVAGCVTIVVMVDFSLMAFSMYWLFRPKLSTRLNILHRDNFGSSIAVPECARLLTILKVLKVHTLVSELTTIETHIVPTDQNGI